MIRITNCKRCDRQTICGDMCDGMCATCFNAAIAERACNKMQGVSLARFLEPATPPTPRHTNCRCTMPKQSEITAAEQRARFRVIVGGKK